MTYPTDPTRSYGQPSAFSSPPSGYDPAGWAGAPHPAGGYGYPAPPRSTSHTGWIIGGVVALIVLVLGAVAVFAVPTLLLDHQTSRISSHLDDMTGKNTQEILARYLDVDLGSVQVGDDSYSQMVRLPVTLRNKGDEGATFSVEVEATDASGTRLATGTAYVTNLASGQSATKDVYLSAEGRPHEARPAARLV